MKQKPTLDDAYEAVAASLREFGYPDATAEMIRETHEAMKAGKRDTELPHGIVGAFAEAQISEHADLFARLGAQEKGQ